MSWIFLRECGHLNDENSWNGEDVENPGRFLDSIFKVEEEEAKEAVEKEEKGKKTDVNLVKVCGVPGLKIGEWKSVLNSYLQDVEDV